MVEGAVAMTAVAWVINERWLPSALVHSPIGTDNYTLRFDRSRHLIRCVNFVQRDPIFRVSSPSCRNARRAER